MAKMALPVQSKAIALTRSSPFGACSCGFRATQYASLVIQEIVTETVLARLPEDEKALLTLPSSMFMKPSA